MYVCDGMYDGRCQTLKLCILVNSIQTPMTSAQRLANYCVVKLHVLLKEMLDFC